MLKSYALLDIIDISKALKEGRADKILNDFWNAADTWINQEVYPEMVSLPRQNVMTAAGIQVVVFSDAALLTTKTEYSIIDFYKIVSDFKSYIEQRVGKACCIVNRDNSIEPSTQDRQQLTGSDNIPRFLFIGGSGAAWINLWLAEKAVRKKKDWHDRYSFYCVNEKSRPSQHEKDRCVFKGFDNKEHVLIALE